MMPQLVLRSAARVGGFGGRRRTQRLSLFSFFFRSLRMDLSFALSYAWNTSID